MNSYCIIVDQEIIMRVGGKIPGSHSGDAEGLFIWLQYLSLKAENFQGRQLSLTSVTMSSNDFMVRLPWEYTTFQLYVHKLPCTCNIIKGTFTGLWIQRWPTFSISSVPVTWQSTAVQMKSDHTQLRYRLYRNGEMVKLHQMYSLDFSELLTELLWFL